MPVPAICIYGKQGRRTSGQYHSKPSSKPAGRARLNHQTTRFRLRALRRVAQMWRHQVHGAFPEFNAVALAAIHDVQKALPLNCQKYSSSGSSKVGALVRATDDGHDEISAGPDLLVADRRLQQMRIAGEPGREVD